MEHDMAKKIKIKLPKKIAGVKIPKVIRKGPIGEFMNSGAGQVILAEALVAAAALFTASKTDGVRRLGNAMTGKTGNGPDYTERLSKACRVAGRVFREALHDDDGHTWEANAEVPAPKVKAKKKSSARASSTTTH